MREWSTRSWLRAPGTSSGSNWSTPSRSTAVRTLCGPAGRARGGARPWRATRNRRAASLESSIVKAVDLRPNVDLPYTRLRMATQRDYYDILGVPRGASDDDIKRSFRRLAQQWHPDVNTSAEADSRFKEINEAYQVLSDPQRRQAYDMFGTAGVGGAGF